MLEKDYNNINELEQDLYFFEEHIINKDFIVNLYFDNKASVMCKGIPEQIYVIESEIEKIHLIAVNNKELNAIIFNIDITFNK